MKFKKHLVGLVLVVALFACKKSKEEPEVPIAPSSSLAFSALKVNGLYKGFTYGDLNTTPVIKLSFSAPLDRSSVVSAITVNDAKGAKAVFNTTFENNDSTVVISPSALEPLNKYNLTVSTALKSAVQANLKSGLSVQLITAVDPSDKFPRISDEELLTLVQKRTFKYFWDFGHPVSGMARERDSSGETVTTGGTGFGIMALITGVHRNFISRQEGLERTQKIISFLKNNARKFHGAFPHWLNGTTGAAQPFSAKDNGADLLETSLLMQGLITARQYFNSASAAETAVRNDINELWQGVEWSWFRKNNENLLYWHWSPDYAWEMNMPIRGWNEGLISYVLAASSPTFPIPKVVYDNGWANNGAMKNGNSYYGVQLPLGPANGGPLFFAHYSFLGINPMGLSDAYANYEVQNKAHALIHYKYAQANPKGFYGYGEDCWGLTASDDINGYMAHAPNNDNGVISPTAALSSFPYTPVESMQALKFFYYKLGDKIWKEYGFVDAFSLYEPWFANSFLAIDQGPIIIMIENHRSGLLWDLFMSAPEVKSGMKSLGFASPKL